MISELLGIPVEDRDKFRRWSNTAVAIDTRLDRFERIADDMQQFVDYLRALFAERRAHPIGDLISGLVQAEDEGDKLGEQELFSMVFLLIVAGHETTVNLIGNGTLALLQHPDQLELLKANSDLISGAVEELLRYDGPVETSTFRYAREDVEIGGVTIPKGERVLVVIASADRDAGQFPDADTLDITRPTSRHVAFGQGIHYCLGAPLARMEGQIAIGTLLRRMPNIRLSVPGEELLWRPSLLIRGLQSLPVEW